MIINLNRQRSSNWLVVRSMGVVLLCCLLLCCVLLCWPGRYAFAEPPLTQPDGQATEEEEESLEVQYARAHLELAKLDLKRAEYWNREIPNVISARTIDFLRKHVEVDTEQLRQSEQADYADVHQIYVRDAKMAVELAEADVARKQQSLRKVGGTYAELELDRAVAALNVAKLNLQRTVSQQDAMQSISHLQWQLEELRNQILELQVKVESTPER